MKRRINKNQVKELNKEQLESLRAVWKPEVGDWVHDEIYEMNGVITEVDIYDEGVIHIGVVWMDEKGGQSDFQITPSTLPLLDIYQMILILNNFHTCLTIEVDTKGLYSTVEAGVANKHENEELCDALWNAIKRLLSIQVSSNMKK